MRKAGSSTTSRRMRRVRAVWPGKTAEEGREKRVGRLDFGWVGG